jgi:Acetyltransferase (GNAT) family
MRIDEYWTKFFGVPATVLDGPGLHVLTHQALLGYQGAWLFVHGQARIMSVPAPMVNRVREQLAAGPLPNVADTDRWCQLFGQPISRVVGPAYDGYVEQLAPVRTTHTVRRLEARDGSALGSLSQACTSEEWDHASIDPCRPEPIFGCFVDGQLVGAAQNETRPGQQAVSPGVITAASWRERGIGRAVLAAAIRHGCEGQKMILYQTLVANRAAVRLGESLGVRPYAQHVAFRFSEVSSKG